MVDREGLSQRLKSLAMAAEGLRNSERSEGTEAPTPQDAAASRLHQDTAALREEFIRHMYIDSRGPRTGYDTKLLVDSPKVVRYAGRAILRTLVGTSHLAGSAAAFGFAKGFREYAAPALGMADPFSVAAVLFASGIIGVAGSRLATARWRDTIENSVILERVFGDKEKLESLKARIAAEPGNKDTIFNEFVTANKYSRMRKLATGAISHGPTLLLGAWSFDATGGEYGRVIGELNKGSWSLTDATAWKDRFKVVGDLMWSGLSGDPKRGITGLMGHGKKLIGM